MFVDERLAKIESMLVILVDRQFVREWYTTEQFAQLVGKAEFTVREWCRLGSVHAENSNPATGCPAMLNDVRVTPGAAS